MMDTYDHINKPVDIFYAKQLHFLGLSTEIGIQDSNFKFKKMFISAI